MKYEGITVIEVSGESCANCYTLMPIVNRLMAGRTDAKLIHIEASEDTKDTLTELDVDRVPTLIVLKDDKEVARARGYQPEEILEIWLDAKIEEAKSL